jgi:hypothetical protein
LLISAHRSVFSITIDRCTLSSGSNLRMIARVVLTGLQGAVAPTNLRGLLWGGSSLLRPVLTITKISAHGLVDLFPLNTAAVRLLVPKAFLGADSEAFYLVLDVVQECLLYRGTVSTDESANSRHGKIDPTEDKVDLLKKIIESASEADLIRSKGPKKSKVVSLEYKIEQIGLHLTHRQRVLIKATFADFVGSHTINLDSSRRMASTFELRDLLVISDERQSERIVLKSATSEGNILAMRSKDKLVTTSGREWKVFENVSFAMAPVVIDLSHELFDEVYDFLFPDQLVALKDEADFLGNKLLAQKHRQSSGGKSEPDTTASAAVKEAGRSVVFMYVRFAPVDSIITYKGKRISLNMCSVILKPYVKKRKLTTWKRFLQSWGASSFQNPTDGVYG